MNAYELLEDLRDLLGESTASHWTNRQLLRTINRVQQRYYMQMSMTMGDWFVKKSTALTPVAGVITLPTDCAKPIYLEEVSSGREISIGFSIRDKARTAISQTMNWEGSFLAFPLATTLQMNSSSYVTPVYLWYDRKCVDLHAGTGATGSGENSLVLEDSLGHSVVSGYYNGLYVEVVSGTGAGTQTLIGGYSPTTRALTVSGTTFGTDSEYGLVSVLPHEAYDALLQRAYVSSLGKAAGVVSEEFLGAALADAKSAETAFMDWIQTRVKNNRLTSLSEGY